MSPRRPDSAPRRTESPDRGMAVADTILAQLGGNRFVVMTGAKNILGGKNLLQLRFPNTGKGKPNSLRIELQPNDTYVVKFHRIRGRNIDLISEHEGVFASDLQRLFTAQTGLDTHL